MPTTFEQTAARRVRYLRERLGWSHQDLADRLRILGAPIGPGVASATRDTQARPVGVDEAMRLAAALDVAPVHLLVDPDADEPIQATPAELLTPKRRVTGFAALFRCSRRTRAATPQRAGR